MVSFEAPSGNLRRLVNKKVKARLSEKLQHSVMKFDRSYKLD